MALSKRDRKNLSVGSTAQRSLYQRRRAKRHVPETCSPLTPNLNLARYTASFTPPSTGRGTVVPTVDMGFLGEHVESHDFLRNLEARGNSTLASDLHDDPISLEEDNEVFMALELKTNGTVGCAYFVAATATLYLQDDTRIIGFELVDSLIFQAQPTVIIVPSRAPERLIEYLERRSHEFGIENAGNGKGCSFTYRTVISSDFSAEFGKQALALYHNSGLCHPLSAMFTTAVEDVEDYALRGASRGSRGARTNERNKLMHLGTSISLDNHVTLGCAGALIRDLERNATKVTSVAESYKVKSIQMITYKNCMFATTDTLLALQVFHPQSQRCFSKASKDTGTEKENRKVDDKKSIFDLFHSLTLTPQGRGRLREMFVRPSTSLGVICARHNSISTLLRPDNQAAVVAIRTALKKIKNIRPLLLQLRRGLFAHGNFSSIKHSAWANLQDFCSNVLQILRIGCGTLYGDCEIVDKALSEVDSAAILQINESLTRTIDFQESRLSGHNTVATGMDQDLDNLKSAYSGLQARLMDICKGYKAQLLGDSQNDIVGCIFHPQTGYLLVAAATLQTRLRNRGSGTSTAGRESTFDTWEEALREDGLVYFKTIELGNIDTEFGDLSGRIIELEVKRFHSLGTEILREEEALLCASDAVGDIDSILALAAGAKTFHLSRPRMTASNVLHIREGHHMLNETGTGKCVSNNCSLAGGSGIGLEGKDDDLYDAPGSANIAPSTILLTGPNHSGKSVYLKQTAMILFLAHVGSFVPAEEAVIGITDMILTRIATRESVSRDESAFGVDLRQAAFSINFATRKSLILFDEFGKGTATTDGAALLEALLEHFLRLGPENSPKILAATHFHEIFDSGSFIHHPQLSLFHMSVTVDHSNTQTREVMRFLHRLQEGRSTESFGCNCAAINGVSQSIVERASQITRLLAHGVSLEKICLRPLADNVEKLQDNEDRARFFLSRMAEDLDTGSTWHTPRDLLRLVLGPR